MNYYEKIVILDPNLDDSVVEETIQRIKDVIIKEGGEIFKTDNWGRRKMAYELNKHKKGNYTLLLFQAPPPTILQIEKLCKVIDSIVKFMIVKLTNKKQIAAVEASLAKAAVEVVADTAGAAEEKPAEAAEAIEAAPQPEEKTDV